MTERHIEYVRLDAIVPAAKNAKNHALDAIGESIQRFGYTEPVLMDERTGHLVAGHGRVESLVARQGSGEEPPDGIQVDGDGAWMVPVVRGWASRSDSDAAAALVASNRLVEAGGWDEEMLADLFRDYSDDPEWLVGTGYSRNEFDALLADHDVPPEPLTDPDDVPEPPAVPVTQPGWLWQLGPHRLLCGDATVVEDVGRLMDGALADLVFTDPPYGITYRDTGAGAWNEKKLALKAAGLLKPRFEQIAGDELRGEDLFDFLAASFASAVSGSSPTAAWYIWHATRTATFFEQALAVSGYEVRSVIIWHKSRPAFNFSQYKYQHEPCFYAFRSGNVPAWYGDLTQTTVWDVASESGANYLHPTQKPVALAQRAMANSSKPGDLVLDLFGGSGSTLIAAHLDGREARLLEIAPNYCDVIATRFQAVTGEKPVLSSTGEPHDFLAPA